MTEHISKPLPSPNPRKRTRSNTLKKKKGLIRIDAKPMQGFLAREVGPLTTSHAVGANVCQQGAGA